MLKTLIINRAQITDAKNIGRGVYFPLSGFLRRADCQSVLKEMRLVNGAVWPIPIVLDVSEKDYQALKKEKQILLTNQAQEPIAILKEPQFYTYDKKSYTEAVYGTCDKKHPGVQDVYQQGPCLLGGDIEVIDNAKDIFPEYNFTPKETRRIFKEKGWQTITGFQTRNVPHRGHEFLHKQALQQTDGLFVQPVIGEKKLADFKDEFIIGAYQLLLETFYPKNRTLLGILPLKMRYAGPREALFHALIRKNFGCTHFIVGRDHAGVGDYYGAFEAQKIFDNFTEQELGIKIMKFSNVLWCPQCCEFVFEGQCPHSAQKKLAFSGTKIRQKIERKAQVPPYFMRPEVYHFLAQSQNPLVDQEYNHQKISQQNKNGIVVWFTGLPSSGKSTLADKVFESLKQKNIPVERLDGDIVRQHLTYDLGFSKKDRDENIRRVGVLAHYLSRNGIVVVASFVSPYRAQREKLRQKIDNFIEVFCQCPVEVCEQRDIKGLYAKARAGEIQNFTGISAPYQEPQNPDILIKTDQETIEQSVKKIMQYLSKFLIFNS